MRRANFVAWLCHTLSPGPITRPHHTAPSHGPITRLVQGIEVFSPMLRPLHTNRSHLFLYDPDLYNNPVADDAADSHGTAGKAGAAEAHTEWLDGL